MGKDYLLNQRIILRAVEPEDLNILYQIENDPSFWEISSFTVPYSRYTLRQYIENSINDVFADKQLRLMIVRRQDSEVLGTIDVTDFVALYGRGAVGIAILKEFRREGYAKDALNLLCDYMFGFLRMKQLYAHIPVDNKASIQLFTSCGFQQCGLLRDWLQIEGVFKDAVMMQLIQ